MTIEYIALSRDHVAHKLSHQPDTLFIRYMAQSQKIRSNLANIQLCEYKVQIYKDCILITDDFCCFVKQLGCQFIMGDIKMFFNCSIENLKMMKNLSGHIDEFIMDEHTNDLTFAGIEDVLTAHTIDFPKFRCTVPIRFSLTETYLSHLNEAVPILKCDFDEWIQFLFEYKGFITAGNQRIMVSGMIINLRYIDDLNLDHQNKLISHVHGTTNIRQRDWPGFQIYLMENGLEKFI